MADVRLTATNPEDSSVVPVACNEKGELKLEEPLVVEGPKGDDGEKGDKGDPGDPFSGNFTGNVSFNGDGTFTGAVNCDDLNVVNPSGYGGLGNNVIRFGSSNSEAVNNGVTYQLKITEIGNASGHGVVFNQQRRNATPFTSCTLQADGGVAFANNRAGFTNQGYLWCTTERGDTVMLEATVGGAGLWKAYTPPFNRLEELVDSDRTRPKPEESSRDEPENPQ